MDWFTEMGAFAHFFPDHPALAVDFTVGMPPAETVGYGLAYGVQATPTSIPVYPEAGPGVA